MRNAPLPQLDRGTDYESVRRGFESLTAHHPKCLVASFFASDFFVFLCLQIGTWGQSGDNSEKSGAYSVEDFAKRICGFPVRILDCDHKYSMWLLPANPLTFWALRFRLARIAPYVFPFRRMRAISPLPGNIFALCMLFEIVMARSSPHVSISRRNQAIRNAWRGNLAVKDRFSRRDARNHAWRMILAMGIAPPEVRARYVPPRSQSSAWRNTG